MIIDKIRQLIDDIAREGAEPEAPEAVALEEEPSDVLLVQGERVEKLTSLSRLREAIPALQAFVPSQNATAAMSEVEVAAYDMLNHHGFSRASMQRSGELEDYLALPIGEELERRWRMGYIRILLGAYVQHPEVLDPLLQLAREYRDEPLVRRLREVMDEAITGESLSGEQLIGDLKKCLDAVKGFDETFAREMTAEFMELADRAEYHLNTYDESPRWREMLTRLRNNGGLF